MNPDDRRTNSISRICGPACPGSQSAVHGALSAHVFRYGAGTLRVASAARGSASTWRVDSACTRSAWVRRRSRRYNRNASHHYRIPVGQMSRSLGASAWPSAYARTLSTRSGCVARLATPRHAADRSRLGLKGGGRRESSGLVFAGPAKNPGSAAGGARARAQLDRIAARPGQRRFGIADYAAQYRMIAGGGAPSDLASSIVTLALATTSEDVAALAA